MKYLFALVLVLAMGIVAVMPTDAQAGPIIYRGGAWDRWADTGYVFPGVWGYNYNPGYYSYNPYTGRYYYNSGYAAPYYYVGP
jgi:hypothetical protein